MPSLVEFQTLCTHHSTQQRLEGRATQFFLVLFLCYSLLSGTLSHKFSCLSLPKLLSSPFNSGSLPHSLWIPPCCVMVHKLPLGRSLGHSQDSQGSLCLFPFSQESQSCAACSPMHKNNYFIYFVQFSRCLQSEVKSRPLAPSSQEGEVSPDDF